jgi:hypothetical protein
MLRRARRGSAVRQRRPALQLPDVADDRVELVVVEAGEGRHRRPALVAGGDPVADRRGDGLVGEGVGEVAVLEQRRALVIDALAAGPWQTAQLAANRAAASAARWGRSPESRRRRSRSRPPPADDAGGRRGRMLSAVAHAADATVGARIRFDSRLGRLHVQVLVIGTTKGTGNLLVRQLLEAGHGVRAMVRDPAQRPALADLGAEVVSVTSRATSTASSPVWTPWPSVPDRDRSDGSGRDAARGPARGGPDHRRLRRSRGPSLRPAVVDGCGRPAPRLAGDPPLPRRHACPRPHPRASGLDATIVRPGGLTHDPGTGRVRVGIPTLGERGSIPRADVAAVLAACLEEPATIGATFELVGGDTPIVEDAIAEVARAGRSA